MERGLGIAGVRCIGFHQGACAASLFILKRKSREDETILSSFFWAGSLRAETGRAGRVISGETFPGASPTHLLIHRYKGPGLLKRFAVMSHDRANVACELLLQGLPPRTNAM
jgi:hypothetical protein